MTHHRNVLLVFVIVQTLVSANTFLPRGPLAKPKQTIQQFQVAVVLPPGTQPTQGQRPPGPSSPEYVWVQIPVSQSTLRPNDADKVQPQLSDHTPGIQQPASSSEELSKKCLKPRGQFPSNACNKYVNCWDGVAVEQICPDELVFNPKGFCDYSYNVNCGGKPVEGLPPLQVANPDQVSPTTSSPATIIATLPSTDPNLRKYCLKPKGQFRSSVCNKFVNCWNDVIIEQECPEGLLFSDKGYCDYPHNVDCGGINRVAQTDFDIECPVDFGTFREIQNCSNYFTCIGRKVVAKYTCPTGFSFNDNIGVCDYAERVDCNKEPLVFSPKANFLEKLPEDILQKINNCEPGTTFPLNPQCTAACLCRDGVSEIVQCPTGLAYDSLADKCFLPQFAKC